jgi:hypothetical protein
MAAPNIIAAIRIIGKTATFNITALSTTLLTNAANSGKLIKINHLSIWTNNIAYVFSFRINQNSVNYVLDNWQATTPASPIVWWDRRDIITKVNTLYLEEGQSINLAVTGASTVTNVSVIASYEEIY